MNESEKLLPAERLQYIKKKVQAEGTVRVGALSAELDVSEVTIRGDLADLEQEGLLQRTHGGAVRLAAGQTRYERPFDEMVVEFATQKQRIGKAAAGRVHDGETIILDVGTTTTEIARQLPACHDLVVVTNGLNIALELEKQPVTVVVLGGTLRPLQHSLVNPYATLLLGQLHVDTLFLGCNGVSAAYGVTNANMQEAEIKQAMLRTAKKVIVVADASKIGQVSAAHVADLAHIHTLITDAGANADELAAIAEAGVQIELV